MSDEPYSLADDELLSAYVDGELTEELRAEFDKRLAEEPALRQQLEQLRQLSATVQALPAESLGVDLRKRVMERVAQADAKVTVASGGGSTAAEDRRGWRRGVAWAGAMLAASLLLMVYAGDDRPGEGERSVAQRSETERSERASSVPKSTNLQAASKDDLAKRQAGQDELQEQMLRPALIGETGEGADLDMELGTPTELAELRYRAPDSAASNREADNAGGTNSWEGSSERSNSADWDDDSESVLAAAPAMQYGGGQYGGRAEPTGKLWIATVELSVPVVGRREAGRLGQSGGQTNGSDGKASGKADLREVFGTLLAQHDVTLSERILGEPLGEPPGEPAGDQAGEQYDYAIAPHASGGVGGESLAGGGRGGRGTSRLRGASGERHDELAKGLADEPSDEAIADAESAPGSITLQADDIDGNADDDFDDDLDGDIDEDAIAESTSESRGVANWQRGDPRNLAVLVEATPDQLKSILAACRAEPAQFAMIDRLARQVSGATAGEVTAGEAAGVVAQTVPDQREQQEGAEDKRREFESLVPTTTATSAATVGTQGERPPVRDQGRAWLVKDGTKRALTLEQLADQIAQPSGERDAVKLLSKTSSARAKLKSVEAERAATSGPEASEAEAAKPKLRVLFLLRRSR